MQYTALVIDDPTTLDYFPDDAFNQALNALDEAIQRSAGHTELLDKVSTVADIINKQSEDARVFLRAILAERVKRIARANTVKKPDAA